jgi:hypothetical protein
MARDMRAYFIRALTIVAIVPPDVFYYLPLFRKKRRFLGERSPAIAGFFCVLVLWVFRVGALPGQGCGG